MLRRAWAAFRAETESGIDDLAGVLKLNDTELAVVTDGLENYLHRDYDETDDFESETNETINEVLRKIDRA